MKRYLKPEMDVTDVELESIIAISKFDDTEADPEVPVLSKNRHGVYNWKSDEEAVLEEEAYHW